MKIDLPESDPIVARMVQDLATDERRQLVVEIACSERPDGDYARFTLTFRRHGLDIEVWDPFSLLRGRFLPLPSVVIDGTGAVLPASTMANFRAALRQLGFVIRSVES